MRPRIYSLTLIASAFVIFFAASCKKSNNNSNSDSITATVGSTNFSGGHTQGVYSSSFGVWGVISYNIQGKDTSGFAITIPSDAKVGKTISSDSTFLEIDYSTSNGTYYDAYMTFGHATLTVNSLDTVGHKFSGTFSAVAYNENSSKDSVVITNGKFSTSYVAQ